MVACCAHRNRRQSHQSAHVAVYGQRNISLPDEAELWRLPTTSLQPLSTLIQPQAGVRAQSNGMPESEHQCSRELSPHPGSKIKPARVAPLPPDVSNARCIGVDLRQLQLPPITPDVKRQSKCNDNAFRCAPALLSLPDKQMDQDPHKDVACRRLTFETQLPSTQKAQPLPLGVLLSYRMTDAAIIPRELAATVGIPTVSDEACCAAPVAGHPEYLDSVQGGRAEQSSAGLHLRDDAANDADKLIVSEDQPINAEKSAGTQIAPT